jgi:uncharacterized damage-inducible protein DinB
MSIGKSLLPEIDQEFANTRKVLERCPEDKFDWRPHAKSMTLGKLVKHTAGMSKWGFMTADSNEFDFVTGSYQEPDPTSTAELLAAFDADTKMFREKLEALTDEEMAKAWTLKVNGNVIFSQPKAAVIRDMVLNHAIHHRAQLTVYLRLLDVPVPGMYGPSADEQSA